MSDIYNKILLFSDGAAKGNPGPAGWGVVIATPEGEVTELGGGARKATNNQMELSAAIEGLQSLKSPCHVTLYTDSVYVKDGITKWIHNWKKNGWRTANRKAVKNAELWQALDAAVERHNVTWKWVKGHAGDPGNEKADELARQGMADYQY